MMEYSEILGEQVAIYRPSAPLENIIRIGDDFQRGSRVLPAGHMIRIQDIGVLSALGRLNLKVYSPPRVIIFSTGDEIISPMEQPEPGQIRDVNGFALSAQVLESGGKPFYGGIVPDEKEKLQKHLLTSLDEYDVIIISGGSSIGTRDVAAKVIDEAPGDGVLFHGVSMSPGKPVIYGVCGGKPVFGLSGNPVSAMFCFMLFVRPALRILQGLQPLPAFSAYVDACLETNLSSPGGREDYIRVMLSSDGSTGKETLLRANPVFGGSSLLSTMVKGDGYFVIPRDVEGITKGSTVKVFLF
jgi:molybdopterin molybdotransferase